MKLPVHVEYRPVCKEWDKQSQPFVADADGEVVCYLEQYVGHPGLYDEEATSIARKIVTGLNYPNQNPPEVYQDSSR